jgi:hypothetical protein
MKRVKPLPALPREKQERAFALYKKGLPLVDISHELDIAESTVRAWSCRKKWRNQVRLEQSNPELNKEQIVQLAKRDDALELAVPETLKERQEVYEDNMTVAAVIASQYVRQLEPSEAVQKATKINLLDRTARKALKIERETPPMVLQIGILAGKPSDTTLRDI